MFRDKPKPALMYFKRRPLQRIQNTKSKEKTHRDHIAGRGQVSMSHCNMVHKPISMSEVVEIPVARVAMDNIWRKSIMKPYDTSATSQQVRLACLHRVPRHTLFFWLKSASTVLRVCCQLLIGFAGAITSFSIGAVGNCLIGPLVGFVLQPARVPSL